MTPAGGSRVVVEVRGGAAPVELLLRRLGGYEAVLVGHKGLVRLADRNGFALLAGWTDGVPTRFEVDVPRAFHGQLEHDLAGPVVREDRTWGYRSEQLMGSLERLNRHRQDGVPSPHKPIALLWAIGRLAAGGDRLFPWPVFREEVRVLLAEFGTGSSRATPQYPFWHLGSDGDLWERSGLVKEPTSDDVDAMAGFTAQAAALLVDPAVRAQAVDVLRANHLYELERQPELLRRVGLPVPEAPSALDVMQRLVGREVRTVGGKPNRVLSVDRVNVVVGTERSPHGQPVPLAWVQQGLDLLFERGRVAASVKELKYRSAFVAAVLATLPQTVVSKNPAAVSLGGVSLGAAVPGASVGAEGPDPRFDVLDRVAQANRRVEQSALRRVLTGDAGEAACALCGRVLPVELLVAAHVKQRSECSDEERNDLRNVAMLACSLGCDRLFELGYLAVGADAAVLAAKADGPLAEHLALVAGRVTDVHHPASAGYFAWHREHVFRG